MDSRFQLGIKSWGSIQLENLIKWDVIEVEPMERGYPNRRYVITSIDKDGIYVDYKHTPVPKEIIIGAIRGYPSDDDLLQHNVSLVDLKIDYPDEERDFNPVFTYDMLEDFEDRETITCTASRDTITNEVRLHGWGYAWDKRWFIWDTLKFYSICKGVFYFI